MILPESLCAPAAVAGAALLLLLLWHIAPSACVSGDGRVVVISGCDSGFGNMLAVQLFRRGFSVFAACFTPEGVDKIRAFAESSHGPSNAFIQPLLLDITNQNSVAHAVEVENPTRMNYFVHKRTFVQVVSSRCSDIYALVNNAGIGTAGPMEWMPASFLLDVINVNFLGHVAVTKARLVFHRSVFR